MDKQLFKELLPSFKISKKIDSGYTDEYVEIKMEECYSYFKKYIPNIDVILDIDARTLFFDSVLYNIYERFQEWKVLNSSEFIMLQKEYYDKK